MKYLQDLQQKLEVLIRTRSGEGHLDLSHDQELGYGNRLAIKLYKAYAQLSTSLSIPLPETAAATSVPTFTPDQHKFIMGNYISNIHQILGFMDPGWSNFDGEMLHQEIDNLTDQGSDVAIKQFFDIKLWKIVIEGDSEFERPRLDGSIKSDKPCYRSITGWTDKVTKEVETWTTPSEWNRGKSSKPVKSNTYVFIPGNKDQRVLLRDIIKWEESKMTNYISNTVDWVKFQTQYNIGKDFFLTANSEKTKCEDADNLVTELKDGPPAMITKEMFVHLKKLRTEQEQ